MNFLDEKSPIGYIALATRDDRPVGIARLEPNGRECFVWQYVTESMGRSIEEHLAYDMVRPFPCFPELSSRYGVFRVEHEP